MGSTAGPLSWARLLSDSGSGVPVWVAGFAVSDALFKSGILAVKAFAKSCMLTFMPCKVDKVIF